MNKENEETTSNVYGTAGRVTPTEKSHPSRTPLSWCAHIKIIKASHHATSSSPSIMLPCVRPDAARHASPRRFRPCCSCSFPPATRATLVARLTRHAPVPRGFKTLVVQPACRAACPPQPSLVAPHLTHCVCSPHLLLSISRPLIAERLPGLFPNPKRRRDASPPPPLLMAAGRMCRGASGRSRLSLGHPRARPNAGGGRVPPLAASSHPDGQNQPAQASHPLCCKCML